MAKTAHNSKAPSHCLLHKKIEGLLHDPHPSPRPSTQYCTKNAIIQNNTPRAFLFFFKERKYQPTSWNAAKPPKNTDKGINMCWEIWRPWSEQSQVDVPATYKHTPMGMRSHEGSFDQAIQLMQCGHWNILSECSAGRSMNVVRRQLSHVKETFSSFGWLNRITAK